MSTPFTLEPPGAVGELERRATFPVMPPALSRGRPPTQGTRVGGRGQWRATNPGRSRLRHRKGGREGAEAFCRHARGGKSKARANIRASLFIATSESLRLPEAENCKVFRGANYLPRKSDGTSRFPGDRAITCRAAIPLIFLGSSFLRSFAPRSVQAKGTRSAAFLLESPFTIASRLDTTDRFFPTAPIAARPETGISPGEMASRAQPWLIDRAWTAPD